MLKLGSETGSLTNHVKSRSIIGEPKAEVGMGATLLGWTDRYPATITKVEDDGRLITIQEDNAERADANGMSEHQEYTYSTNQNGAVKMFRKNKHGYWKQVIKNPETGRYVQSGGYSLQIGERNKYHDFSF